MAMNSLVILLLVFLFGYNIYVSAARASGQALPKLFGWCSAVIISGSMSGTIEIDDLVVAREQESYQVNDVVLFRDAEGTTTCHRIVGKEAEGFITKGDANNASDWRPVPEGNVYAKVKLVLPRVGFFYHAVRTPLGLIVMMTSVVALILLPYFLARREDRREEKTMKVPLGQVKG